MVAGLGLLTSAPLCSLLFLGIGGGALPLHLATHHPRCRMVGVESDARVLEQLVYKWRHSRDAIAPVLAAQYVKLHESGWGGVLTEADIQSDVERLFGGAFEAFLAK